PRKNAMPPSSAVAQVLELQLVLSPVAEKVRPLEPQLGVAQALEEAWGRRGRKSGLRQSIHCRLRWQLQFRANISLSRLSGMVTIREGCHSAFFLQPTYSLNSKDRQQYQLATLA